MLPFLVCTSANPLWNGLTLQNSNLVGYVRWDARSDQFPPCQTIFPTALQVAIRVADSARIADECKAIRGLRSDWLATEHVLQAYRGSKHSGFAATLCSQLQT